MKTPNAPGAPRGSGGGQYGKGVSKSGAAARGIGKAKPKTKGLTAAEVKTIRQARLDDAREMQEVRYTGFSPLKSKLPNLRGTGGTRFNPSVKRGTGTSVSRGTKSSVSKVFQSSTATAAKEAVKSGASKDYALPKKVFGATNSARQKPVPTKPSKPKVQKKTGRK